MISTFTGRPAREVHYDEIPRDYWMLRAYWHACKRTDAMRAEKRPVNAVLAADQGRRAVELEDIGPDLPGLDGGPGL